MANFGQLLIAKLLPFRQLYPEKSNKFLICISGKEKGHFILRPRASQLVVVANSNKKYANRTKIMLLLHKQNYKKNIPVNQLLNITVILNRGSCSCMRLLVILSAALITLLKMNLFELFV